MEMTFRWFGKDFDTVTLEQIRQILLGHKPQIRQRVLLAEARVEPCGVLSQNEPAVSHRQDLRF